MDKYDGVILAGGTVLSIGVGLFDYRIGLIVAGVILIVIGFIGAFGASRSGE